MRETRIMTFQSTPQRKEPNWLDDRAVGDWLMVTLRMFGVDEANAHKITGMFLEAING